MGHAPITMDVQADNDETALQLMMAKAKPHLASVHANQPMTDDQIMGVIKKGWKKS